jgi:hypothetical protein
MMLPPRSATAIFGMLPAISARPRRRLGNRLGDCRVAPARGRPHSGRCIPEWARTAFRPRRVSVLHRGAPPQSFLRRSRHRRAAVKVRKDYPFTDGQLALSVGAFSSSAWPINRGDVGPPVHSPSRASTDLTIFAMYTVAGFRSVWSSGGDSKKSAGRAARATDNCGY